MFLKYDKNVADMKVDNAYRESFFVVIPEINFLFSKCLPDNFLFAEIVRNTHFIRVCQKIQKWSYHDSTPLRSVVQMYLVQKYFTVNHRLKIYPTHSNLNLQRILWKFLLKMSKSQLSSISRVNISKISILRALSHFY